MKIYKLLESEIIEIMLSQKREKASFILYELIKL